MLINISENEYQKKFPENPHLFLSKEFINLNKSKADQILWLVEDSPNPTIGIVVGLIDSFLYSPFSAPFGGFHFNNELIYISFINEFIGKMKGFIQENSLKGISITLPPNIYHETINSKFINCLFNNDFKIKTIDITSWVDLESYSNRFSHKSSREYINQALKNGLHFHLTTQISEKIEAYELIRMNRLRKDRPIFMSFEDLEKTNDFLKSDYFVVKNKNNEIVASAIIYQTPNQIAFAVFWGDNEKGRPLRAMDFCVYNLLNYYKQSGYKYLDIGISTEEGFPNEGLLRFKETHEATSSLRHTFTWSNEML